MKVLCYEGMPQLSDSLVDIVFIGLRKTLGSCHDCKQRLGVGKSFQLKNNCILEQMSDCTVVRSSGNGIKWEQLGKHLPYVIGCMTGKGDSLLSTGWETSARCRGGDQWVLLHFLMAGVSRWHSHTASGGANATGVVASFSFQKCCIILRSLLQFLCGKLWQTAQEGLVFFCHSISDLTQNCTLGSGLKSLKAGWSKL